MNFENTDMPYRPSRVWILTNSHPGNRIQAIGLAEALGWNYEVKELSFNRWSRRRRHLPFLPLTAGLDRQKSSSLAPPWPDLTIGVGRSTAPISRWIRRISRGRTRTVHLGRGGGPDASRYDAVITPIYCRMPPDSRRYEVLLPLNSISPLQLAQAREQWPELLQDVPRPVVVFLVGGDASSRFRLSAADAAAMAARVRHWTEAAGGSVAAVTNRRTGEAATRALQAELKAPHCVYSWTPFPEKNPYRALLAKADVLVVTGESESMLAEAAATTAPLYIFPLPEIKSTRLKSRLREWSVRRAFAGFSQNGNPDRSAAGILDGGFSWMMRHSLLRPRRDLSILHKALYAAGRARPFGTPLQTAPQQPLQETEAAARWLKTVLQRHGA
jgi:hypothetical protein